MPKTILLADDSSTIRKIVELTFNGTDISVEAFDSGAAALAHLARIEPDLILADVVMPEPSGYELCKHVKSLGAGIPVVLAGTTGERPMGRWLDMNASPSPNGHSVNEVYVAMLQAFGFGDTEFGYHGDRPVGALPGVV